MKKIFFVLVTAIVLLAPGNHALAESITCKDIADVTIDEWSPDENLNYKDRLTVATNKNIHHGIARALILFDIPSDVVAEDIKSAVIYLSGCSHCGGGNGGQIAFYALNKPFSEDNDTWNTLNGGDWDEAVYSEATLPGGNTWNQAVNGEPVPDAAGMDVTELLQGNLDKVRDTGIMVRFFDEHQEPFTHQNIASRESQDPLDFAPRLVIQTKESPCPAELVLSDESKQLDLLRSFRDRVLSKTPEGRHYIKLYYQHASEISGILADDRALNLQTRQALKQLLPAIMHLSGLDKPAVPTATVKELKNLIEAFQTKASPELKSVLSRIRENVVSINRQAD